MQNIHTTHLFLKLGSAYHFEAIMFGLLFDEKRKEKSKIPSHVCPVRSTLAYRVMHQAEVVHAGLVLAPQERTAKLHLHEIVISTLFSVLLFFFCTNNAQEHRCITYFSIGGTTAGDQIGQIALICMCLLVFGERNKSTPPPQTHTQ